jgi:signal transduction histidine kinase/GAF domain-containing protein
MWKRWLAKFVVLKVSAETGKEAMETRRYTDALEESAVVERVVRIVSSVRGTKPDYTRLAAELEQAIPFDVFGVVLLRHDRQAVRVTICQREAGLWVASYHQHPCADSKLELMLQSPQLIVNDYPDGLDGPPAESGDALSGQHQLRATLIAPLLIEDRMLGTLELGSVVPHIYANTTLQRLVNAVAHVLAAAIEGAQLGGSAAIQDRQRQALKDVSSALTSKMDLASILNQIVTGIARTLGVASAIIMFDRREERLRLEAQSGFDPEAAKRVFNYDPGIGDGCIVGLTILSGCPYFSQDIAADERFPSSGYFFTELGMRSVYSYPLGGGATVYGTLLLCSHEPGGFTPLKGDILALFADQATVAIHNGMLLEAARQRSRFQESVERFEGLYAQHSAVAHAPSEEALREEFEYFVQVREEAQRNFNISLSSLLHFISNRLLTRSEYELQDILYVGQDQRVREIEESYLTQPANADTSSERLGQPGSALSVQQGGALAHILSLLTQTTESTLERTDMLGALGRLIMGLGQPAVDGVKDAWFIVNLQGVCVYMSPAAEALCEMRTEGMTALYDAPFFAPPRPQEAHLSIEDVFARLLLRVRNVKEVRAYLQAFAREEGESYQQALRCVVAVEPVYALANIQPGSEGYKATPLEGASSDYHYQFTRHALSNQHGQPIGYALRVSDVTEQVRDEKNRSALLSAVSHDLRTPLTTIKAAVTGLLEENVAWSEQDRRGMLEDINTETDHLTVLVNALVELSRIEMGALILEKEWCDVLEVLYGVFGKLESAHGELPIRIDVPPHLPLIYADHRQLGRVFYNLVENAVHRSAAHGKAEVVVRLEIVANTLRAQVIDYGESIPDSERGRIFKSFHSLRSYGDGLGLAICRGIVAAHQGTIAVEAAPHGGTCFTFTLPIHAHAENWESVEEEACAPTQRSAASDEAVSSPLTHEVTEEGPQ